MISFFVFLLFDPQGKKLLREFPFQTLFLLPLLYSGVLGLKVTSPLPVFFLVGKMARFFKFSPFVWLTFCRLSLIGLGGRSQALCETPFRPDPDKTKLNQLL